MGASSWHFQQPMGTFVLRSGQLSSHVPWRATEGLANGVGRGGRGTGLWFLEGRLGGEGLGQGGALKTLRLTSKETCCHPSQHRNHVKGHVSQTHSFLWFANHMSRCCGVFFGLNMCMKKIEEFLCHLIFLLLFDEH